MRLLLTGGCGFVGHHFVEHLIKTTDWDVIVLDKLTYASDGYDRLRDINCFDVKRVKVLGCDFAQPIPEGVAREIGQVDYIVHMGAETHVDNSIEDPYPFVMSNVVGTHHMLEFAKTQSNLKWFCMFSTDEVYGPALGKVQHTELDRYNATNPYAATKAGAEQLANAYANTYKIPLFTTNTMNVFGERQHPEKFIPLVIRKVMRDEEVVIHSDPTKTISGSRYWIHARNVANAICFLLQHAEQRGRYNIVGEKEVSNLDMAYKIANILGCKLRYDMVDFHSSRPGHDLRYALDGTKMKEMGWELPLGFDRSLEKTVRWIVDSTPRPPIF